MKSVSAECKDLIKRLLMPEKSRITIQEVFEHPWMKVDLSIDPLQVNFKKLLEFRKYSKVIVCKVS